MLIEKFPNIFTHNDCVAIHWLPIINDDDDGDDDDDDNVHVYSAWFH